MVPDLTIMWLLDIELIPETIVTGAAFASTTGGLAANSENIIHESIIITASKQTAVYPFKKLFPTFCVGSPPKLAKAIGEIAVYKYILKNLPIY